MKKKFNILAAQGKSTYSAIYSKKSPYFGTVFLGQSRDSRTIMAAQGVSVYATV